MRKNWVVKKPEISTSQIRNAEMIQISVLYPALWKHTWKSHYIHWVMLYLYTYTHTHAHVCMFVHVSLHLHICKYIFIAYTYISNIICNSRWYYLAFINKIFKYQMYNLFLILCEQTLEVNTVNMSSVTLGQTGLLWLIRGYSLIKLWTSIWPINICQAYMYVVPLPQNYFSIYT